MAKNIQLQVLLRKLARGEMQSGAKIREALKSAEINVLKLTNLELDNLNKVLDADLAGDRGPNARTSARETKKLIEGGVDLEESGLQLAPTTYSKLSSIGKSIGRVEKNNWHLGHSGLGNAAHRLGIVLQYYKVGGARHLNVEESRLIESAILGAQKLERLDEHTLTLLQEVQVKDANTLVEALSGSIEYLDIDLIASAKFARNALSGNVTIDYVFENAESNKAKGDLTRNLSTIVGKYLRNISKHEHEALSKKLHSLWDRVSDPFSVKSSPTLVERIIEELDAAWENRKSKNKKSKSKIRETRRLSTNRHIVKNLQKRVKLRTKNLLTKIAATKRHKKFITPTVTLKAILNESLAEFIRLRMESSNASSSINYLRNQTGNFSESAFILTLNRSQTGSFFATYTYQHEPYSIFETGNKLGSPGRDPRLYIEGAAREIAMLVLKKQFVGLAMESK